MSPDTIVPTSTQGTQAWDRYAFVNNNPVRYTDPTGHEAKEDPCDYYGYGTPQCPYISSTSSASIVDTIHDVANEIDDTEDDVKNALSAITGIGVSLIVTCPATGGTTCVIASGLFGAGMGYLVGEDMYLDDTTVENLGKVADMFAHATPNEQGLISVSMSFQSESGDSMVQFDENTRYLEMNPSFHEDQFELQIGGRTITLTPAQAIIVNAILGGGLLP